MEKLFLILRIFNIVLSFIYQSSELQEAIKELSGEKKKPTGKVKNIQQNDSE